MQYMLFALRPGSQANHDRHLLGYTIPARSATATPSASDATALSALSIPSMMTLIRMTLMTSTGRSFEGYEADRDEERDSETTSRMKKGGFG